MPTKKKPGNPSRSPKFSLQGSVNLQQAQTPAEAGPLFAYAFDQRGTPLGQAAVDAKGAYSVPVELEEPAGVRLAIGPESEPQQILESHAHITHIKKEDWKRTSGTFTVTQDLYIAHDKWIIWWPKQICISGHIRKIHQDEDGTEICPVPFLKVEIFDVDREPCFGPFLRHRKPSLLDSRVIRIPKLIEKWPPIPDPGPYHLEKLSNPLEEIHSLDETVAHRLDDLTLTAKVAPWVYFPNCFYSKQLICETTTNEHGFFNCCFKWWPFHFRHGRLRFDSRPDIIIRVTQIIDGVESVVYMDPYSSTRWNVCNAHVDLFLDNDEIHCGSGDDQNRPPGSQVFFTRIGDDEVYKINQGSGMYNQGTLTNVAYGHVLNTYAQFGDTLSNPNSAPGQLYYRLSYSKTGGSFTAATAKLDDTRVNKSTNFSESYNLGPKTIGTQAGLYEVRNFNTYLWYNPDLIGAWNTLLAEADTGKYVLRLEVFNAAGTKLTSTTIDYRDGTVTPPAVLPPMTDRCDLVLRIDNKAPVLDLDIPAVINTCGVIPGSSVPPLNVQVGVTQENGRLRRWQLQYTKGVLPAVHVLAGNWSSNGSPSNVSQTVNASSLVTGLTSTCAFAIKLWAQPHIRNGRNWVYYREVIKAIAIDY